MRSNRSLGRRSCSCNEPSQGCFSHFTTHVYFAVPTLDCDRRHFRSKIHFDGRGLTDAGHVRGRHVVSTTIVTRLEKARRFGKAVA